MRHCAPAGSRQIARTTVMSALLAILLVLPVALAAGSASAADALNYLESLKGSDERYKAPSELDDRFIIALYVNAATEGPQRQRMWVLQRDRIGGPWRLALWDTEQWNDDELGVPPYSWLVSTGRHYPGQRNSGPTPNGLYALDARRGRYGRGFTAPGMIHTMYIDYHYADGRRSGVAFHGTTRDRYRRLGTNDSHGCIRMTQENALALFDRITGRDRVLPEALRWGEVPRFWQLERGPTRWGYTRDGTAIAAPALANARHGTATTVVKTSAHPGATLPSGDGEKVSAPPEVLTKTGFRAVAVIFAD